MQFQIREDAQAVFWPLVFALTRDPCCTLPMRLQPVLSATRFFERREKSICFDIGDAATFSGRADCWDQVDNEAEAVPAMGRMFVAPAITALSWRTAGVSWRSVCTPENGAISSIGLVLVHC